MLTAEGCPKLDELRSFSLGNLPEADFERIAAHISFCNECNSQLETMDHAADELVADLHRLSRTDLVAARVSADLMAVARRAVERTSNGDSSEISIDPGRRYARLLSDGPFRLGKFELQAELGVGSFGYVFRARDTELDRTVAVKIQRGGGAAPTEDVERFMREARSVAQLQHSGVVALYETGQTDEGVCFLVTEFIEGQNLEQRLHEQKWDFHETADLIARIADALQYAHDHGVIHRDVKPSNIIIDVEGRPHLMDFGLARRTNGELTMTSDGRIVGTPAYMSPEQARGESHQVDARSDVYSLGVILYEMITGERPFQGNRRLLLLQVLEDEPRPPRRLQHHIPRDLEIICLKAMAKSPSRRYQTARQLADDLRAYLNGRPIQARPVGWIERLWRWRSRNPLAASLLLAVSLASVIGFFYLSSLSTYFVQATALDSARMEAAMFEEVNAYYSELIDRLDHKKIKVTHEYVKHAGSLPLPATFTIVAGERISETESGMKVRLYSGHPWRPENGPKSKFETDALKVLQEKLGSGENDLTYHKFTSDDGRQVLLFAKGQLMKKSCLGCHNKQPQRGRTNWKEGDLAGVLAIVRPLDRDITRTYGGLRGAFLLTAAVAVVLTAICLLFASRSRRWFVPTREQS